MKNQAQPRDFRGYGDKQPKANWPNNARVAVSIVVNVEEGAELSLSAGDERNENMYAAGISGDIVDIPDLCMESHYEYGTRAGYWRIATLLDQIGAPATMSCCGRALEVSPWLAKDMVKRGYEISAHSYRWEPHAHMDEDHERQIIRKCVDSIRSASGIRPIGWHTKSQASMNTRRLLVQEGGFLYDSNAYNDDLPYIVSISGRSHIVLPYAFDTNDMRFEPGSGFVFANDFSHYCIDAFDQLWHEGAETPKMMSVGLHLRIIGRPARIAGLEKLLTHMKNKGGVWFARREQIARHWRALNGLSPWPD